MELKELEKKTVVELREMARTYEDITGAIGMKKEQLVEILCKKLGIEKKHAPPKGIGRKALKERVRALKAKRDAALSAHDAKALKRARTLMRRTKHHLRDLVELANKGKVKPKEGAAPAAPAT
ncbi:MAG: Rho termination factor N-terminal domain-containing protein [Acidobacteria bacterium]|nr:Rho termination factor N-terminal domain-containing protein [Acidobacteriota bacterium]